MLFLSLVGVGACDNAAPRETLVLRAFDNLGVQPDSPQPIVKDARTLLPSILRRCGVPKFDAVDASDSLIAFRFVAGEDEKKCISAQLPPGAELRTDLAVG